MKYAHFELKISAKIFPSLKVVSARKQCTYNSRRENWK